MSWETPVRPIILNEHLALGTVVMIGEFQISMDLRRFGGPLGAIVAELLAKLSRSSLAVIVASSLVLGACSSMKMEESDLEIRDPYEGFNRWSYGVNQKLDKYIFGPIVVGYTTIFPRQIRNRFRNVLNNADTPVILANDLLQTEFRRAGTTFTRFGINSTVGLGGMFDVAGKLGYEFHREDFGQTLAVWGVGTGPYLFFPFLGPTTLRDGAGMAVDTAFDPLTYVNWDDMQLIWVPAAITGVDGIDAYSRARPGLKQIEETSLDPYASLRSLYQQSRRDAILNGETRFEDLPSFDDEEDEFDSPEPITEAPEVE